jgi:hypothetical protein
MSFARRLDQRSGSIRRFLNSFCVVGVRGCETGEGMRRSRGPSYDGLFQFPFPRHQYDTITGCRPLGLALFSVLKNSAPALARGNPASTLVLRPERVSLP